MPHRILDLPPFMLHAIEAVILGIALGWNAFWYHASLISDEDWGRITGPHGVAFIAVVAVIVLWLNKLSADKTRAKELAQQDEKEDKRRRDEEINREKRHAESLAASHEYAEGMKALAVETMKVTMKVDKTLFDLTQELAKRPCNAVSFKTPTKP